MSKTCKKCGGIVKKGYSSKDHSSVEKVWKCACCYEETPIRKYTKKKKHDYKLFNDLFNELLNK